MTRTLTLPGGLCLLCLLVLPSTIDRVAAASPGIIGIDFVGNTTAMSAGEVAGVVARSRWNAAAGVSRSTALTLRDEFGASTGATVTWTSSATMSMGIANQAGNHRLMKGYVEGRGTGSARVSIAGLAAATYDVYVYVDGDNGAALRTATYQMSGTGIATTSVSVTDKASTNFQGTYTEAVNSAGNYTKFRVTGTGFTLTATPQSTSGGTARAPVNAMQIVPVAVPTPPPAVQTPPTPIGPTMTRANSYDNAWESAWVNHGRALLTTPGKTAGFVLQIGDSITHSRAYSVWARQGQGQTADDAQVMAWARAGAWSSSINDVTSKNGWYLTGADTTTRRGMTSAGGLSTGELVSGCCNPGPTMPATLDPTVARQLVANATYAGNLQIDTVVAAFRDAQFAVVMLGTNEPWNPTGLLDLDIIVTKLEAAGILPILSTIPPRNDGFSNQFTLDFNVGVRALARSRSLPLIDYYEEMLLRRPGLTWVDTLISTDGVHPTGDRAGFTVASNPYLAGGDAATHTTGDALANVGYLLRSWLTVQKLKEVKRYVVDGINP